MSHLLSCLSASSSQSCSAGTVILPDQVELGVDGLHVTSKVTSNIVLLQVFTARIEADAVTVKTWLLS